MTCFNYTNQHDLNTRLIRYQRHSKSDSNSSDSQVNKKIHVNLSDFEYPLASLEKLWEEQHFLWDLQYEDKGPGMH